MILEMHCHTIQHSLCSHIDAADLVQSNFAKGLQGTVLTDHQYLWSAEEIRELRSRLKVPDHYIILSGQEVETPELGHILVYGADVSIERGTSLAVIRRRFPSAAIIWAHPYRDENIPSRDRLFHPLIDGVEIFNSNHTVAENNRALLDWHRYKFTAVSGSDTHAISYTGLYPTFFDHPLSTIHELADEIRSGRCRPFFKEIPRSGTSNTRVMELTIGTGAGGKVTEKYVVRSHNDILNWRSASRSMRIMEEIGRHGFDRGRFRIPKQFARDEKNLTVIEQGIQGMTLYDALVQSNADAARQCLQMSAEWLVRLHNLRLQITPPGEFLHEEPSRLEYYLSAFYSVDHPHTRRAQEIMETVIDAESALYCDHPERMVQGHGDYHPKNIFIGRDNDDRTISFVAAIDFNSSYSMPPAYDVGTFLAQFRNQFYGNKEVLSKISEEIFLETYLQQAAGLDDDFLSQVELFKARTTLSICYFLIKVGLGRSENLWRVLMEAQHILAQLSVKNMGPWPMIEQTGKKR
jgi:predicted metal-dependent phosphoesterase TrpH/aminoglycoside phosphotransferase (APT) family kinase protein